ncbi:MAG: tripartite tricarboxylate transporter TctB family protein [Candidatus Rokuibacteriota bacterium]
MASGPEARRDRWSVAGLAVLALAYLYASRQYPLDALATPGPGVVPLVAGVALLLLASWQLVAPGHRRERAEPSVDSREVADQPPVRRASARAPGRHDQFLMVGLLVAYAASLGILGFLAASFALVVLAARLMGAPGWWRPALLAAGVTVATYLLFAVWLGLPLPAGLFH